jgi:hypothetical protein
MYLNPGCEKLLLENSQSNSLNPADLIGRRRQIEPSKTRKHISHVQMQITSEGLLFLPLHFFALGEYILI